MVNHIERCQSIGFFSITNHRCQSGPWHYNRHDLEQSLVKDVNIKRLERKPGAYLLFFNIRILFLLNDLGRRHNFFLCSFLLWLWTCCRFWWGSFACICNRTEWSKKNQSAYRKLSQELLSGSAHKVRKYTPAPFSAFRTTGFAT